MKKPMPPCKDCRDRQVGCHAACEKYREFTEANDKYRAESDKIEIRDYIRDRQADARTKHHR